MVGGATPKIVLAGPPDPPGAGGTGLPHVPQCWAAASTAAPQYGHGLVACDMVVAPRVPTPAL